MKNITQNSTAIESQITDVTVYLSGAQVTRSVSISAKKGAHSFVFEKLPVGLTPETIQVSAGDSVVIRSVEHTVNHLQTADHTEEITALQKQLDELNRKRKHENNQIELGQFEENILFENIRPSENNPGFKAEELKSSVLFYNERMAEIRETRMTCEQKLEEIEQEISVIQLQLGGFSGRRSDPVSEITVTVAADADTDTEVTLSYFVHNASWQPFYDIRAKDATSDIALHCKASVSQNTGENWDEVKLTLSTGNPSVGGDCPDLKPWYIDFHREVMIDHQFQQFNAMPAAKETPMLEMVCKTIAMDECVDSIKPAVTVTQSTTSVEYNIKAPYAIASGDGGQDVEIVTHNLPAKYRYYSVRKLEREVFLLAAVSGWEHLNLIAGEASIFFENRYVGKTHIDPRRADEAIDLSLGVDKSVIVTRVRGKDFTAKTLTGGSVKQTRQWELTVRNLKTNSIDIEVLDQVPVSVNKQIVVDILEISGAEMDKDTGILTWKLTLEPAEAKSMAVKYVVTSPKNDTVLLD